MTSPYSDKLEELVKVYKQQRADLGKMQREIQEITATVSASQQAVTVTVGATGNIIELSFPTGAYRRMAPAELAAVLTATIEQAKADAARQMQEVMTKYQPEGGILDLVKGAEDWSDLLPPEPPEIDPFAWAGSAGAGLSNVRREHQDDDPFAEAPRRQAPPAQEYRW